MKEKFDLRKRSFFVSESALVFLSRVWSTKANFENEGLIGKDCDGKLLL